VDKVSCGESHTLLLMKDGTLMSSGSNELFQLGRALPEGENESDGFEVIKAMRGINIKEISAWNMCACIAENKDLYIWGSLVN
jgi:Regulator of chromosome condensation (RCC1) repeat